MGRCEQDARSNRFGAQCRTCERKTMREAAAIVVPAIDLSRIAKRVDAAHIELQDAERAAKEDEERSSRSSERAAHKRLLLGRELCEARKAWPARGPNAKGWGEWLAKRGIEQQRAWEYMRVAGYADEVSPENANSGENIPSLRD